MRVRSCRPSRPTSRAPPRRPHGGLTGFEFDLVHQLHLLIAESRDDRVAGGGGSDCVLRQQDRAEGRARLAPLLWARMSRGLYEAIIRRDFDLQSARDRLFS